MPTSPTPRPVPAVIRPATPAAVPALVRVAAETFPDACPPTTSQEAKDEHIASSLNAEVIGGWVAGPGHAVHLAEAPAGRDDAGRLLGYVMAELAPEEEPAVTAVLGEGAAVGCLSKLYVVREARGTGAAAALMAAGLDALRVRGLTHAWLGTSEENHRANAFYERVGFRTVGSRTFLVGGRPERDNVRLITL